MKTLGRILIILVVFSALSGLMVLAVNASGSSSDAFRGTSPQFESEESGDGIRPEGTQTRPEHRERGGAGGSRWMFGLIKNVGVMALLVTLIVLPKSIARNKRKQTVINSATTKSVL